MQVSLTTNQLVTVTIAQDDANGQLKSRFEGVEGGLAWFSAPTVRGVTVWPPLGATVKVSWLRPDAVYSFTSTVREVRSTPVPMLGLVPPKHFEREQRRESARVDAWLVPDEVVAERANGGEQLLEGVVTSLSAGGALLWLKEPLALGSVLRLRLRLPNDEESMDLRGEVVRMSTRQAAARRWYAVGVRFISPTLHDSKRLAGYVLRQQAEQARREKED